MSDIGNDIYFSMFTSSGFETHTLHKERASGKKLLIAGTTVVEFKKPVDIKKEETAIKIKHLMRVHTFDFRLNNIPDIRLTLNVQSMNPDFGSLYGGTSCNLVITGDGFSLNSSEMSVTVGPHSCSILEAF
ncbi:hypothetical protein Btru_076486 [Bulinus truncatus]|nr:hypothetical protein Btru_076486 [Bulinus truncatus]